MLTDKDYLAFINDKSLDNGSLEEKLNKIIDEELEKSEEKIDTDLIEHCLDVLSKLEKKTININEKREKTGFAKKHTQFAFKKAIMIAAVIPIIIGIMVLSFSSMFDFNKRDIKMDNHQFLGTELAKELAENGFDEILLPEKIFSRDYVITDIEYQFSDVATSAIIDFKYKNKNGCIYTDKDLIEGKIGITDILDITSDVEIIELENITVYCFTQDETTAITYREGLTTYYIQLPMNPEEAIEFAKTIKQECLL
ncbi:MAG: hypothetical protein GX241_00585 [Ruminococcaceae bacterium]|nr:hypothetical protein [Oscillospiraceae bacterium]